MPIGRMRFDCSTVDPLLSLPQKNTTKHKQAPLARRRRFALRALLAAAAAEAASGRAFRLPSAYPLGIGTATTDTTVGSAATADGAPWGGFVGLLAAGSCPGRGPHLRVAWVGVARAVASGGALIRRATNHSIIHPFHSGWFSSSLLTILRRRIRCACPLQVRGRPRSGGGVDARTAGAERKPMIERDISWKSDTIP